MRTNKKIQSEEKTVLSKALLNSGKALGLSQEELGAIIGRDRSSFARGIEPHSKSGELALLLIRCYRSLYALVGGNREDMRHWMHTPNRYFSSTPAEQIKTISGLVQITEYLDAIRGKV